MVVAVASITKNDGWFLRLRLTSLVNPPKRVVVTLIRPLLSPILTRVYCLLRRLTIVLDLNFAPL